MSIWLLILLITCLQVTAQAGAEKFTITNNYWYYFLALALYGVIVFSLAKANKKMNFAVVNAIWSGLSVVAVAIMAHFVFKKHLNIGCWISMGVISIGFLMLTCFQK